MYPLLLFLHSICRWLVVSGLLYAIYRGARGWAAGVAFTKHDNTVRHVVATIAHVQLAIGYILYFNSPLISYFRAHYHEAVKQPEPFFFGLLHIILMTIAVVVVTVGSSLAKRKGTDLAKFRTMALLFALALLIIFIAIPWPFSPLARRPYLRPF